jgi:hypothetical protein
VADGIFMVSTKCIFETGLAFAFECGLIPLLSTIFLAYQKITFFSIQFSTFCGVLYF